jgi:hypothetical protein
MQHVAQRSDALQNRDRYELGVWNDPGSAAHRFTLRCIRETIYFNAYAQRLQRLAAQQFRQLADQTGGFADEQAL